MHHGKPLHGAFSTEYVNARVSLGIFLCYYFEKSDLPGVPHMGSAAGADVIAFDLDDPHRTFQLLFASVFDHHELVGRGIKGAYCAVFPDRHIDGLFYFKELFIRKLSVVIHGHIIIGQRKAYI